MSFWGGLLGGGLGGSVSTSSVDSEKWWKGDLDRKGTVVNRRIFRCKALRRVREAKENPLTWESNDVGAS